MRLKASMFHTCNCLILYISETIMGTAFSMDKRYAYVDHNDIRNIYKKRTVFLISPPEDTAISISANVKAKVRHYNTVGIMFLRSFMYALDHLYLHESCFFLYVLKH